MKLYEIKIFSLNSKVGKPKTVYALADNPGQLNDLPLDNNKQIVSTKLMAEESTIYFDKFLVDLTGRVPELKPPMIRQPKKRITISENDELIE